MAELKDIARAGSTVTQYTGIAEAANFPAGQVITKFKIENAAFSKNGEGGVVINSKIRRSSYAANIDPWKIRLLLFTYDIVADGSMEAGSAYEESNFADKMPFANILFDSSETDKLFEFTSSDANFNKVATLEAKSPSLHSFVCEKGIKNIWGALVAVDVFDAPDTEVLLVHLDISR